jgi:hypothetical protein
LPDCIFSYQTQKFGIFWKALEYKSKFTNIV